MKTHKQLGLGEHSLEKIYSTNAAYDKSKRGPIQPGTREPVVEELFDLESEEEEEAVEIKEVSIEHPSFVESPQIGQGPTISSLSTHTRPSRGPSPVHTSLGLGSSLGLGLGLEESCPSQPRIQKEKGRQVPARYVLALAEKCAELSRVPEFLEELTLVETNFIEGDSVDDGLGVYLLDFDEENEPRDLGLEEDDLVSAYVDGTKRFDEPTMAIDVLTNKINLGTEESLKELLVVEELWNDNKKLIFFPVASVVTCTDSHLEVHQSTLCQYKAVLDRNPRTCPFSARFKRRPCERDGPIGRVLWSCHETIPSHVLNTTKRSVATLLPDLTTPSHSSHPSVAFCSRPVAIFKGIRRDVTFGSDRPVAFFICTRCDLRILH
ncbi:hypothetical protein Taro_047384 [Colocasia esculenta]|uniref:Uncharacterized protein n=1 Tax=Colocasia esculenta TaxID=4460 RepID=A0A843X5D4_COLES|nr:hypothetical protein [Colocasia esculenta]